MEALQKMRQLKEELQHARKLVGDVRQREKLKRELLVVGQDVFEQVRCASTSVVVCGCRQVFLEENIVNSLSRPCALRVLAIIRWHYAAVELWVF
jgi:hypothetical protein